MKISDSCLATWTMRYQPDKATKSDAMTAATIMCAYRDLILKKTQKERNRICERLKAEYYKAEQGRE